jgi:hypothetical protein
MDQYFRTGFAGVKTVMEQSFLLGLSQSLRAIDEPGRYGANYVENAARGIVPNIIAKIALGSDEFVRDPDELDLLGVVESRIPFLSERVPVKIDVFGREVRQKRGVFSQLFDPFASTKPSDDAVTQEFLRLKHNPPVPAKGLYTDQEYRDLLKLRGNMLIPLYFQVIDGVNSYGKDATPSQRATLKAVEDGYKAMTDDAKKATLRSIELQATTQAHGIMKIKAAKRLITELDDMSSSDREKKLRNIEKADKTIYDRIILLKSFNNISQ